MSDTAIETLGTHTAKWTDDCQGKKDFDGEVLSISTRYWPAGGGFHVFDPATPELGLHQPHRPDIKPSAHASLILCGTEDDVTLADCEFEAATEAEVKEKVETWVAAQWHRAVRALAKEFGSDLTSSAPTTPTPSSP